MFEGNLGSAIGSPDPAVTNRYQPKDVIDGRYVVQSKLGYGGMGTVLKVGDPIDKKLRALKYCNEIGEDRKRFAREVRIMQHVTHKHVVPVLAANLDHDPPYFVMPLAVGCLADEIDLLKADETAALSAFKDACLGIQALHAAGVIHRDLKPHNLLRQFGGHVAVSDLGLAKLETRDTTVLTQTKAIIGTMDYLAPEQCEPGGSRESDARTDIYQLGLVLYYLLTGRSPRGVDVSLLPNGLSYVVQRATNPAPENRYRSIGQLLDTISNYEVSKQESDSQEAFENLVQEATGLLAQGQTNSGSIQRLLAMVARHKPDDYKPILTDFDRIPERLLSFVAEDFSAELLPGLKLYNAAIRAMVSSYPFEYADSVAARMSGIFRSSKNVEVQQFALMTLLIAAADLHRFHAMGIFNKLLTGIKDVGLALPIAEMLGANTEHYKVLARGVPTESLHPAIRTVRDDVVKRYYGPPADSDDDDDDIPF
jgi:eukaryotic-like serine/threonine-protein kinase